MIKTVSEKQDGSESQRDLMFVASDYNNGMRVSNNDHRRINLNRTRNHPIFYSIL
jgi:hypothetical protein